MKKLERIIEDVKKWLDQRDELREFAIKQSRDIIRLSSEVIQDIHRGKLVETKINELRDEVQQLLARVGKYPEVMQAGFVRDALQEYCEAIIFKEIVERGEVPDPEELSAPLDSYILGLCDVIGELRRKVLDSLRKDRIQDALTFFNYMEEMYAHIMKLHYPQGLIPLRSKQDSIRAILERTRSDITMAMLISKISEKKEEEPLDIDKVFP